MGYYSTTRPVRGLLLFTAFFVSYVSADECLEAIYKGNYRRSPTNLLGIEDNRLCDEFLDPTSWYRFNYRIGSKMAESCVSIYHCGTYLPIWMNGTHPTANDPGPVTRKVCAGNGNGGDCCDWSDVVKVKWCRNATTNEEYYVYQVTPPPVCDMAYCIVTTQESCASDCAWNDVLRSCTCPAYPIMGDPTLSDPYISATKQVNDSKGKPFTATRFSLNCTVGYHKLTTDNGARFRVEFLADGFVIPKTETVNSTNPTVVLDELDLKGHLGKSITCRVYAYWQSSEPLHSITRISNAKWLGIRPTNQLGEPITKIVVHEGEIYSFCMQATFPITSAKCFTQPSCNPRYTFRIAANSKGKVADCRLPFTTSSNLSSRITISPVPSIGTRSRPFIWLLGFDNQTQDVASKDTIFHGYKIQDIVVEIVDPLPRPMCSSTGDPHVTTFPTPANPNRLFYNVYMIGDFYMVKSTTRYFQIQVRYFPCNPEVSCVCGVMVREGNNILGINACRREEGSFTDWTPKLIRYLYDAQSPSGTIEPTGSGWTIKMISGVEIHVDRGWKPVVFDIHVIGLTNETYDGLCTYSGNQTDYQGCSSDCDRYRVSPKDSFFNYNTGNYPNCSGSYSAPTCDCEGKNEDESINVNCSPDQSNILWTGLVCDGSNGRRKRATSRLTGDFVDIDSLYVNFTYNLTYGRRVGPPKIDKNVATQNCRDALNGARIYKLCEKQPNINFSSIIDACVGDIQLLNNFEPTKSVVAQLERLCIYTIESLMVETSSGSNPTTENLRQQLNEVQALICPNQCSNRGTCVNSSCICYTNYVGNDCSLQRGQPPSIVGSLSPVCDLKYTTCRKIYVEAVKIASPEALFCQIKNSSGTQWTDNRAVVSGGIIFCSLPSTPTAGFYSLSLSNDGNTYSSEITFEIYNSVYATTTFPTFSTPTRTSATTVPTSTRTSTTTVPTSTRTSTTTAPTSTRTSTTTVPTSTRTSTTTTTLQPLSTTLCFKNRNKCVFHRNLQEHSGRLRHLLQPPQSHLLRQPEDIGQHGRDE